jgi:Rap1a immunity proteins
MLKRPPVSPKRRQALASAGFRYGVSAIICATFLSCSHGAIAEDDDISLSVLMLHHVCHDSDPRSKSACSSFLVGFIAGLQMNGKMAREGKPVCPPGGITSDYLISVLDKIIKEKPEFAALPALDALGVGLQTAFPCKKK